MHHPHTSSCILPKVFRRALHPHNTMRQRQEKRWPSKLNHATTNISKKATITTTSSKCNLSAEEAAAAPANPQMLVGGPYRVLLLLKLGHLSLVINTCFNM
jgi:hypothetical protein